MAGQVPERIIDAEFTIVDGPKPGDAHPSRKGWFLTHLMDRRGNPLWYKPPGKLSRAFYLFGLWAYRLMFAGAVLFGLVGLGAAVVQWLRGHWGH